MYLYWAATTGCSGLVVRVLTIDKCMQVDTCFFICFPWHIFAHFFMHNDPKTQTSIYSGEKNTSKYLIGWKKHKQVSTRLKKTQTSVDLGEKKTKRLSTQVKKHKQASMWVKTPQTSIYSQGCGSRGGPRGAIAPTFCLNGMAMPVPPPKFWQSLGMSTFLPPPPQEKNRSRAPVYSGKKNTNKQLLRWKNHKQVSNWVKKTQTSVGSGGKKHKQASTRVKKNHKQASTRVKKTQTSI